MHVHRAKQFKERLMWNVNVLDNGEEKDEYDFDNPTYIIVTNDRDEHVASMRLKPFTSRTMVVDYFPDFLPTDFEARQDQVETTRFCVSPEISGVNRKIAIAILMSASCQFGLIGQFKTGIGLFDQRMERIYQFTGWTPEILARHNVHGSQFCLGQWEISSNTKRKLDERLASLLKCRSEAYAFHASAIRLDRKSFTISEEVIMSSASQVSV